VNDRKKAKEKNNDYKNRRYGVILELGKTPAHSAMSTLFMVLRPDQIS
jgi:hypothetical protein